jgi:hypothetical protein
MKNILKWSAMFSVTALVLFALIGFVGTSAVKADSNDETEFAWGQDTDAVGVITTNEVYNRALKNYENWLAPRGSNIEGTETQVEEN